MILRPLLVVLSGLPLSGKSYIAEALVTQTNLQSLDVDMVRNEMDDSRKADAVIKMLAPDAERKIMVRSYIELCHRAEAVLLQSPIK